MYEPKRIHTFHDGSGSTFAKMYNAFQSNRRPRARPYRETREEKDQKKREEESKLEKNEINFPSLVEDWSQGTTKTTDLNFASLAAEAEMRDKQKRIKEEKRIQAQLANARELEAIRARHYIHEEYYTTPTSNTEYTHQETKIDEWTTVERKHRKPKKDMIGNAHLEADIPEESHEHDSDASEYEPVYNRNQKEKGVIW